MSKKAPTPPTWAEQLAPWSAREIADTLGCARVTAHQWLDASKPKAPQPWQRALYLFVLNWKCPKQ
jgi:hypothetical protein